MPRLSNPSFVAMHPVWCSNEDKQRSASRLEPNLFFRPFMGAVEESDDRDEDLE